VDGVVEGEKQVPQEYQDLFLHTPLSEVDPALAELIGLEAERQARRLILIPSESMAPRAVREALGSVFTHVYAEGWPPLRMTREEEAQLLDFGHQLTHYRRYGDRRFYKGTDYVHFVETLAQRRAAHCFANERVPAEHLHVNVQPLSGAAANLAVYEALLEDGDTLMGMDLFQGGHLTHGSEFNVSGRRYRAVSYGVDEKTERLDYDRIRELALAHRPRLLVAGFTSYPWAPDWEKFREIADACGAYLMADIAHTAGLVVAGAHPSPIGLADVVTFTTHKTLCGPRGAVILTQDEDLAQRIDAAVFPGLQGGPHTNKFAAMAVAFHIARTDAFRRLQHRIVENAQALAAALERRGLRLAYGGTDTHLLMVDLRPLETPTREPLRGEVAVRILELAGLVANKNTVPGDDQTALGRGVRLGTPWVTQRGMGPAEMDLIADCIARLLTNIHPFSYQGLRGELPRGKIDLDVLEAVKRDVAALADAWSAGAASPGHGYPHYCFSSSAPGAEGPGLLLVCGTRAKPFLQEVGTANLAALAPGERARTLLLEGDGRLLGGVAVLRLEPDGQGRDRYVVATRAAEHERIKAWFRGLSDGYLLFDPTDVTRKVQGPVIVHDLRLEGGETTVLETAHKFCQQGMLEDLPATGRPGVELLQEYTDLFDLTKPYFIGQHTFSRLPIADCRLPIEPIADCRLPIVDRRSSGSQIANRKSQIKNDHKSQIANQKSKSEDAPLQRTPLFEAHRRLSARLAPFAGWEMPVWYTNVSEEHRAVRQAAGLFDVAHMGVLEVAGEHAASFLDVVSTNYVRWLEDGQSQYSYLLDPDGRVIDDILVYRRAADRYLVVVNAANAEKDWAWLNAVNEGAVGIDRENPAKKVEGRAVLRDLKDPAGGADQRVDLALQGPASRAILQALTADPRTRADLARLRRTELVEVDLAGLNLIVARTGYTGEEVGYELFVHPDQAETLWNRLLERGEAYGLKPAGLAARDSTRTEAGLPLYGHELAGEYDINPHEAGFSAYVKFHKPFFIGREASLAQFRQRTREVVRFRLHDTGVRALRGGEAVVSDRGHYLGRVTSCTLVEGIQLGMAILDRRQAAPGTALAIYPAPARQEAVTKAPADLEPGDRVVLPLAATVLSRFPGKREGKERKEGESGE